MVTKRTLTRRQVVFGAAGLAVMATSPPLLRDRIASATVDIYVVTSGPLRLRSGPGLSYSVLASLPTGARMEIIEDGGTADGYAWAKVWVSSLGKTGFVARTFIAREGTSGGGGTFPIGSTVHVDTASGASANLRSSPSITASVVRIVANGTTGTVQSGETASSGYRWVKLAIAGTSGYMATTVLAAGAGTGTQPPPPPSGGTFPVGSTVHVDTPGGGNANMRSGAGLSYGVIATFASGTTGTVQSGETANNGYRWVKVTMGGVTGYMATSVLAAGSGGTTPPPASDTTETFPVGSTVHLDTTSGGAANLRSGAGLSYAVVKIVPNGTTATVLSEKTMADGMAWVKISVLGTEGWMSNGCLSAGAGSGTEDPGPDADVLVADGPVNVRAEPGLKGTILGTVPTGATGEQIGEAQEADGYSWVKVHFFNQLNTTGWVATAFLTLG